LSETISSEICATDDQLI